MSLISWSVTLLSFLKKVNFLRTWSAIDVNWISHAGGCTLEPVFSLCVLLKQELNHKEFFVNKPTTSVTGTKYKSFQLHGKVTFLIIVFFVHLFEIYFLPFNRATEFKGKVWRCYDSMCAFRCMILSKNKFCFFFPKPPVMAYGPLMFSP